MIKNKHGVKGIYIDKEAFKKPSLNKDCANLNEAIMELMLNIEGEVTTIRERFEKLIKAFGYKV